MGEKPFLNGRERVTTGHTSDSSVILHVRLQEFDEELGKWISTGCV